MATILFDLDGTIIDSSEGITMGAQYALRHFGIAEPDLKKLEKFIGPPLKNAFTDFYGVSEENAPLAVEKYREYYRESGVHQNILYPGIEKMLSALKSANFKLLLATSKPEVFAEEILTELGINNYFDFIAGALMDGRTEKDKVIIHALKSSNIEKNSGDLIMVGDRKYDIIGARKLGIPAIGVLYGFGDLEELEKENPLYIEATVEALEARLLSIY